MITSLNKINLKMAKNKKRVKSQLPSNVALNPDQQKKFEDDIREKRKQGGSTLKPGVIRLSHIPWGFFEHDIKDYFKQFGRVSRIRLSRSKRTGNSRGYAYIEYVSEDVARIAAEAMNNYLMFGKLLKCRFMERVHPKLMKGANRKFRKPMTYIQDVKRHNQIKTETQQARSVRRFLGAYKKKMNKLAALGINYQLDGIEQLQEEMESKESEKKLDKRDAAPGTSMEESPKEMSLKIPSEVHTPKGTLQVLKEDSSDEEIIFKTPPFSIKSSKLDKSFITPKRNKSPNVTTPESVNVAEKVKLNKSGEVHTLKTRKTGAVNEEKSSQTQMGDNSQKKKMLKGEKSGKRKSLAQEAEDKERVGPISGVPTKLSRNSAPDVEKKITKKGRKSDI